MDESAPLPLVIPTGAQRSGGICGAPKTPNEGPASELANLNFMFFSRLLARHAVAKQRLFRSEGQGVWEKPASPLVGPSFGVLGAPQIPPLRYPEFLSRLVALADSMRLSLMKAAHVELSGAA
jgi:hypothetical protein